LPAGEHAVRQWHATSTAILQAAMTRLHPGWQHLLAAAGPALRELSTAIGQLAGQPPAHAASPPP
jgi:hypothetical protein